MMNGTLEVLNLKNNNLSGPIPDTVPVSCGLWTLNLNGNQLDGPIPKSLAYCSKLENKNNSIEGNMRKMKTHNHKTIQAYLQKPVQKQDSTDTQTITSSYHFMPAILYPEVPI
ncbi:hypothetical protein JHK87_006259 [Glycine soja]|nr:hypothetical protein JHK87_006259 [Glycine soja]